MSSSSEITSFEEEDYFQSPPADVIAYNELRSCADLYRMYDEGILDIQPDFQRDVVWSSASMTRFVDSLIKQLPIPSMCFSLDFKTQKWQVIDGLQRLSSIIGFLDPKSNWKLSNLRDIDPVIAGISVKEFRSGDENLALLRRRVENTSIPITVLRCDYSKIDHTAYLFTIFHRLNTGGVKLNNQEIRNCIFSGPFNDLLKTLNKNVDWQSLTKQRRSSRTRYLWIEQILRFFAFIDCVDRYAGSLSRFLNDYMAEQRFAPDSLLQDREALFVRTVGVVSRVKLEIPDGAWSRTFLETMMFGVAANINSVELLSVEEIASRMESLRKSESLSSHVLSSDLSSKEKVTWRLREAQEIFRG